jgi:hypothetical protein
MAWQTVVFLRRLAASLFLTLCAVAAQAAERMQPQDIDLSALARQMQTIRQGDGIQAVFWWPPEFWDASFARQREMPADAREEGMSLLGRYSLLGIAQAEVLPTGAISFHDRASVTKGLKVQWSGLKGVREIVPLATVPEDLQPLMNQLRPMMESSFGDMGRNLHIFVIEDFASTGGVLTPYETGALTVQINGKSGAPLAPIIIESPLDALFAPRMCPNGKPAHVSWKVCPWDGTKLPD